MPSIVFAEDPSGVQLYGSIRAGVLDDATSGLNHGYSRWGLKGQAEAAEGLTAMFQYERDIDSTDASDATGRLSYVGLSGGFGTIKVGKVGTASSGHAGFTNKLYMFGSSGTTSRLGDSVSYSVSVGNVGFGADVQMKKGDGMSQTVLAVSEAENTNVTPNLPANRPAVDVATTIVDESKAKTGKLENKTVDGFTLGATLNMESGKIAVAHERRDAYKGDKNSKNYLAGQYTIGGMTLHLGTAQQKLTHGSYCLEDGSETNDVIGTPRDDCTAGKQTNTSVFAGASGSLGDTGVGYVFQVRSEKTKGTEANIGNVTPPTTADTALNGQALAANKHTPWALGLTRSLGGGAVVVFEHENLDQKGKENTTGLWLVVNF